MDRITLGHIEIRVDERRVLVEGRPVELGSRAFDVLLALAERRDRVATKDELLQAVWPGLVVEENNLTVQVSAIRRALGPGTVATVVGRGYRLTAIEGAAPRESPRGTLPGNLPQALPRLYGRDDELRALVEALDESPLLTLCGPGGIGKTLLALHAAQALQPRFASGAWLVDLSTVQDGSVVTDAVAHCLGIRWHSDSGASTAELADALRQREALLVLDNCEHVVEAVATLALSLRGPSRGLRVMATSQEPLHVSGERVVRLAALAVPATNAGVEVDPLGFGAVRLFVERVRALQGRYDPDESEVIDVVSICRSLDGNALAIELVASRVPLLGSAGVRSRLAEWLHWKAVDHRSVVQRHRTLHQALDWSHRLLGPSTQAVFRRLGVFVGGFSLEAAQRVLGPCPVIDAREVLDHLALLVDRSLLTVDAGRLPRYRMLETTREFALACLGDAGDRDIALREHAHAMRDLCVEAARRRDPQWTWLELPNMRAALRWALEAPGEADVAVALATYPSVLLAIAGSVPEATANLERVRHLVDERCAPALAARYWQWVGRLGIDGRVPSSRCIEALQRAAHLFESLGDLRHLHGCRRHLAEALARAGELVAAQREIDAAIALEGPSTPPADRMRRLRVAGLLAGARGQHPEALRLVQAALTIAEAHDIERYRLTLMADMSWVQMCLGAADAAVGSLTELLVRLGERPQMGYAKGHALAGLTAALLAAGRVDEAQRGALRTLRALQTSNGLMPRGDIFAWLVASTGHLQVAAQVLGASDRFCEDSETQRDRVSQLARQRASEIVVAELGPSEAAFWSEQGAHADATTVIDMLDRAITHRPAADQGGPVR